MLKFEPDLDIFESNTFALCNPISIVGVRDSGLAKNFHDRYPENYRLYKMAVATNQFKTGSVMGCYDQGKLIINVPTKWHWRNHSTLKIVQESIDALAKYITSQKVPSVAIPRLGCGLGGLLWKDVCPLLVHQFDQPEFTNCVVTILGPSVKTVSA